MSPANKNGLVAVNLWMRGRAYTHHTVTLDQGLADPDDFSASEFQKSCIVLHSTVGNGGGARVLAMWNNDGRHASAHFVVERTSMPGHPRPGSPPTESGATMRDDRHATDAVTILAENVQAYHGSSDVNQHGIGIEVSNYVNKISQADLTNEPSLVNDYRLEHDGKTYVVTRPADENRWIHLEQGLRAWFSPDHARQNHDFQFWEDEQYESLIMLLRRLCTGHRIPRRFLGVSVREAMDKWNGSTGVGVIRKSPKQLARSKSIVFGFRGLMVHHNIANKPCPGVIHRNRLFRGISDEWWMPVDIGPVRRYYSGPFAIPVYDAAIGPEPALFHWDGNELQGTTIKDSELELLYDTTSHFDMSAPEAMYTRTEQGAGGYFPIGNNRAWHGGVHLNTAESNRGVYAAASGLIVAARLTSEPSVEADPVYGSQRFVLIRHAAQVHQEIDPDGHGDQDLRVDYGKAVWVYSLYMHLAPVADLSGVDAQNPPWLNLCFRRSPDLVLKFDGDPTTGASGSKQKGQVFCPDVEVDVGDFLGRAGSFGGRDGVSHFEIFTGKNAPIGGDTDAFGTTPWDQADDTPTFADAGAFAAFLAKIGLSPSLPVLDWIAGLRRIRFRAKSEWSFTEADLEPWVANTRRRKAIADRVRYLTWVDEAIAVCPSLEASDQFGGTTGEFHFYHPITFMMHMNELVRSESVEHSEENFYQLGKSNVVVDGDGFIRGFIDWSDSASKFVSVEPDSAHIKSTERSKDSPTYSLRRKHVACIQDILAGNSARLTTFSLALLNFLEQIAESMDPVELEVSSAYLSGGQIVAANCCLGPGGLEAHREGLAADILLMVPSPNRIKDLWTALTETAEKFNTWAEHACGNPAFGELPVGIRSVEFAASPAEVASKLTEQRSLTNAEAASCRIHVVLVE